MNNLNVMPFLLKGSSTADLLNMQECTIPYE